MAEPTEIDFQLRPSAWLVETAGTTRHLFVVGQGTSRYRRLPGPGRSDWQGSSWLTIESTSAVVVGETFFVRLDPGPQSMNFFTRRSSTVSRITRLPSLDSANEVVAAWEQVRDH